MPDTMYMHNQLARGGTWSRWSDQNIVAFERYDYREGNELRSRRRRTWCSSRMNDKTSYPGDISFDDGVSRTSDGYYLNPANTTSTAVSNSRGYGNLWSVFRPARCWRNWPVLRRPAVALIQKLLVHGATTSSSDSAVNSRTPPTRRNRLIYVGGQTLASGGGAIELNIPSDVVGHVWLSMAASRAAPILRPTPSFSGKMASKRRTSRFIAPTASNGDPNYNPLFPFKMRGSVDPYTGNPVIGSRRRQRLQPHLRH